MILQIFDVEHGACALLTCDNGTRIMIDCGHNATTGWYPGSHLARQGITSIDMLIVTNYDEDHVSGIENLLRHVLVGSLTRNPSVSAAQIRQLKSEDGMGAGIERLTNYIANLFTGGSTLGTTLYQGMTSNYFWNVYPYFDDENNLSLIAFLKCAGVSVLFPGDLEAAGWRSLLTRADFIAELRRTSVMVAAHHGRRNGWCEELRQFCNPYFVVISDKGYMHETQETLPLYQSIAKGGTFRGETRYVLTTRNDGLIQFQFNVSPPTWCAY